MNVFRLLRFFLPLQNPLGFGLTDYIELGLALLLLLVILCRGRIVAAAHRIAKSTPCAMALLFALPIALRLALLPRHPIPIPQVADDFSYLLLGDTLRHFRLANAPHPMSRFFETVFVLQDPSYSSIYPPGQGIVLMFGWAGVLLSIGLFCALCYWMLRGWMRPAWALLGGLIAVMEFGPLCQWTNNYWGGAVSGIAGCLVFGALPRLRESGRPRDAALLGLGMGLQVLTRPFEAVLLAVCVLPMLRFRYIRHAALAFAPALLLTVLQNHAVTGSWTALPYMLSRAQYGVPASFTFQPNPGHRRELNQEQLLDYQVQREVHDSAGAYIPRLVSRVKFIRFFFYPPLCLALLFAIPSLRRREYLWAAGCLLLFALGTNIYPYFYPHYVAAITCIFLLFAVTGLEALYRTRKLAMWLVVILCAGQFGFWYSVHLFGNDDLFIAAGQYESWDYVNFGDSEGRRAMEQQLSRAPGQQLVFVRYSARHLLRTWIHNDADIDGSRVVWALDRGGDNAALLHYYPSRTAWLIEPDAVPPRLAPYPRE